MVYLYDKLCLHDVVKKMIVNRKAVPMIDRCKKPSKEKKNMSEDKSRQRKTQIESINIENVRTGFRCNFRNGQHFLSW